MTKIGARFTADYTQGYGPEEVLLRKATAGEYSVIARYYGDRAQRILGPVTVQVEIYTHYGTDRQEKQELTLQLEEVDQSYTVGTFTVE